jgi:hypothetical protein
MATYLPSISYTSRDFSTIRSALVDHVKIYFPDWQEWSESNLGVALLELVAYVGDNLSFYLDRTANELYLSTVTQRQNIINLVKLIGYSPRTASAASARLRARIQLPQSDDAIIRANIIFTDKGGTEWEILENTVIAAGTTDTYHQTVPKLPSITWETLGTGDGVTTDYAFTTANISVVAGTLYIKFYIGALLYNVTAEVDGTMALPFGGTGIVDYDAGTIHLYFAAAHVPTNATLITASYQYDQKIVAYQGRTRMDQYSGTGLPNQSYVLSDSPVLVAPIVPEEVSIPDPSRFEVWLGDPGAPFGTGAGTLWARVDSLVSASAIDTAYQIEIDDKDRITVMFGDGSAGAIPPSGSGNINIIYRVGGGVIGNIAVDYIDSSVSAWCGLLETTVRLTNYEHGSGGSERESLSEIRVNAPAYLRTNDSATTESDFDSLSSLYSKQGAGAVARAKCRLTPPSTISSKAVYTSYVLGTSGSAPVAAYYFKLPSSPIDVTSVSIKYMIAGLIKTVVATQIGTTRLASLSGDASIHADSRIYMDEMDVETYAPTGFIGDGVTVNFASTPLDAYPVYPSSVFMHYTIDDPILGVTDYIAYDNGLGVISGAHITTATVNYSTGAVAVLFDLPPTLSSLITYDYQTALYLKFAILPDSSTNINISVETGPSTLSLPSNNVEVYIWDRDGEGNLVPSASTLKDNLKSYLDLRRVLCTSVQILDGFNCYVNIYLTITYSQSVNSQETAQRIITALQDYFASIANIKPGEDVPLAGIYHAIYPMTGVDSVVVQDIGLRVVVGTGDAHTSIIKTGTNPGTYISSSKLPAVMGTNKVIAYKEDALIGYSDAAYPVANITGSGLAAGSTFNLVTGQFDLRLNSTPYLGDRIFLEFNLDEVNSTSGVSLWNTVIDTFEIAILGRVYINNVRVY